MRKSTFTSTLATPPAIVILPRMSIPAANTRSKRPARRPSTAAPSSQGDEVDVESITLPCPFPHCTKEYTKVSSLKRHLLSIRGSTHNDRLHPRDSEVWHVAEEQGYLYAPPRGEGVTDEERTERRKTSQAGHYQANKEKILKRQAERIKKQRAALQAANQLVDRLTHGSEERDGGVAVSDPIVEAPKTGVAELFDVGQLDFAGYLGMEDDGEPDLGEFCRFVLHFVPPPEWPSGIPSVEGKFDNPPLLIDCIPNKKHFRRIGLLVHPDKAAQRSFDVAVLPPNTQTRLNSAWDVWHRNLKDPNPNIDDVRIWPPGKEPELQFKEKYPGLWRCWATYQREKNDAFRRFAPTKSGFTLFKTAASVVNGEGSVKERFSVGVDELRLIQEIKSVNSGVKRKRG
jgi:hypothetical protein